MVDQSWLTSMVNDGYLLHKILRRREGWLSTSSLPVTIPTGIPKNLLGLGSYFGLAVAKVRVNIPKDQESILANQSSGFFTWKFQIEDGFQMFSAAFAQLLFFPRSAGRWCPSQNVGQVAQRNVVTGSL